LTPIQEGEPVSYLKSGLICCALCAACTLSHATTSSTTPAASESESAHPSTPFSRAWLLEQAELKSHLAYVPPTQPGLGKLGDIGYNQYRDIRFQNGASIWEHEDRGFTLDLFHPGFIYKTPVELYLVVGGRAREVHFTPQVFNYGPDVPQPAPQKDLAYSGFRVRYAINDPEVMDEFLVFQGASYFRAVGRGLRYGLSARGLAVKTAEEEGEEFPAFTQFWIERPTEGATSIVIHALLDSPSVTGAYSFTVTPGDDTRMDVACSLFPRVQLKSFGIAPLTSMFLFDASNRSRFDDFRNAVHDSDGLRIVTGRGERLWRPLANPHELQVSEFLDADPRGFGLAQRERSYAAYADAEARYELRPSAWVEPQGHWGRGAVELVEIPSEKETHDNIVAFWRPAAPLAPGERYDYDYHLHWLPLLPEDTPLARVAATRIGEAADDDHRLIVVDFDRIGTLPHDVHPQVSAGKGTIANVSGEAVAPTHQYRASFELDPKREDAVELRLVLVGGGKAVSETWLYRWTR
jgi:periplasmic glucans biosynthesis protein